MKLTPLDIHHKEFRHSLRGYSEEEVDGFLEEVADDFERLFKENIELSERSDALSERLRNYQLMESTINHTLVNAQRSADELVAKAHLDADAIRRDAESKAMEIVHDALQRRQDSVSDLSKLKQAEESFRRDFRTLLERQLKGLEKSEPQDDVSLLLGEADAGSGAAEVPKKAREAAHTAPIPVQAAPESTSTEPVEVVAEPVVESAEAVEGPTPATLKAEITDVQRGRASRVESVSLGEVGQPELPLSEIAFEDPDEFAIPGLASFGEREEDIDIEEID